nr:hypothetical protein [Pseudomonas sp. UBA4617]
MAEPASTTAGVLLVKYGVIIGGFAGAILPLTFLRGLTWARRSPPSSPASLQQSSAPRLPLVISTLAPAEKPNTAWPF